MLLAALLFSGILTLWIPQRWALNAFQIAILALAGIRVAQRLRAGPVRAGNQLTLDTASASHADVEQPVRADNADEIPQRRREFNIMTHGSRDARQSLFALDRLDHFIQCIDDQFTARFELMSHRPTNWTASA